MKRKIDKAVNKKYTIDVEDDPKTVGAKFKSLNRRLIVQGVALNTTSDVINTSVAKAPKKTSLKECVKLSSLKSSCCNFKVQLCGKPGLGSTRWFACIRCGKPCDTK